MDHSYQLSRPSIETIIDYCNDLLADEKLTVFEFGENCDLVLNIYKDEEFNPALDKDYSNIVTIHTAQDGKWMGKRYACRKPGRNAWIRSDAERSISGSRSR